MRFKAKCRITRKVIGGIAGPGAHLIVTKATSCTSAGYSPCAGAYRQPELIRKRSGGVPLGDHDPSLQPHQIGVASCQNWPGMPQKSSAEVSQDRLTVLRDRIIRAVSNHLRNARRGPGHRWLMHHVQIPCEPVKLLVVAHLQLPRSRQHQPEHRTRQ